MLGFVLAACAVPTTWIVDASNGPGTNFVDLPAAVAAAQSGDTILVRSGTYSRFSVSGKALTIRGAGSASTIVALAPASGPSGPSVAIAATPPGETFNLSGLTIRSNITPALEAMDVLDAKVVLTDCTVTGVNGVDNWDAGIWTRGSEVHASRCIFRGAPGASIAPPLHFNSGAMIAEGSTFAADACVFEGGAGIWWQSWAYGGDGITVSASTATLSRCNCRGGDVPPLATISVAGAGAAVQGGTLRVAGTSSTLLRGGAGMGNAPAISASGGTAIVHGPVTLMAPATAGPVVLGAPPLPYLSVDGTLLPSKEIQAASPVTVDLDGLLPDALYFFVVADAPDYRTSAPWGLGEILLSLQAPGFHVGLLDSGGHLTFLLTPASVPALLDRPIHSQAGVFDAATGQLRLSQGNVRIFSL